MELLKFLKDQIERDDVVGDLAKDAASDSGFPVRGSRNEYRAHLVRNMACAQALDALEQAMDEAEQLLP